MPFTILAVDDDVDALELLATRLRGAGYRVWTASNGREALWMVRQRWVVPSLVILDLEMPVLDGWEFVAHAAHEPLLDHVPIVIVTGTESSVRPRSPMIRAILNKPLRVDRLLEIIAELDAATLPTTRRGTAHRRHPPAAPPRRSAPRIVVPTEHDEEPTEPGDA